VKNYDKLWTALAASRISTLEELVHVAASNERLGTDEAILVSNGQSEPAPSPDQLPLAPPIVHRYPAVPLSVDGKLLQAPEELDAWHGKPLYYTPVRKETGIALAAFSARDAMLAEARALRTNPAPAQSLASFEHLCTSNPDSLPEQVCFFEHIGEGGDVKCLAPARAYPNLLQVGRVKVGWWYTTDWNDVISSVSWCRWDVTLYEHINYGGSQLFLPAGCNTPNLVELGWNDRASGVVNWGSRW